MSSPVHRALSALVLALWMAPSVGALAVAVHVSLDHDVRQEAEPADVLSDLARAAAHGHHHDADITAVHGHAAVVEGVSHLLRPSPASVAMLPLPFSPETSPTDRSAPDYPSRRGPPTQLFTTHCSLLL